MRFLALAAALLAPVAIQAVQFTNSAYTGIKAGAPFTLTWSGDGTPVAITLETGPKGNLVPVKSLAAAASGTSLTVTIPDVPAGNYAFLIIQSSETNYSPFFSIASTLVLPSLSLSSSVPKPTTAPYPVGAGNTTTSPSGSASASVSGVALPTGAGQGGRVGPETFLGGAKGLSVGLGGVMGVVLAVGAVALL